MTDRDIWTQSVNLLNWTDGQKPGRNSNYPKNPRGQRQLRGLCLGWSSQSCYHSHTVWTDWKYRHNKTRTRNTSQIQTRQDRRRTTWQIIRWYTSNHMFFLWVRKLFPTWSISCEMSGQTRCRRWPAPLRDVSPWQRMFVETKSRAEDRRGKTGGDEKEKKKSRLVIYASVDCWLALAVSLAHFSLPSPHSVHLSFTSLLSSPVPHSSDRPTLGLSDERKIG